MATMTPEQRTQALIRRVQKMSPDQRTKLLGLARPRMVQEYTKHLPHPKQQVFLSLSNKEAMYGGAAGGGKSDALLMAALQYVDVPGYSALILRRTWPDLNSPGAILDRARSWLSDTPAREREGGRRWEFPSGAVLSFGYMQHDKDKLKFQSAEYQFVGFDELTHFDESQYLYLFSRIRRPDLVCLNCGTAVRKYGSSFRHTKAAGRKCPSAFPDPLVLQQYGPAPDGMTVFDIPLRMRSATNPGGPGHDWVRARFVNAKTREEDAVFVPALLKDNPSLDQESYTENLEHLRSTDRERLLKGDWEITESGDVFERHWFPVIDTEPAGRAVRFWDNASTAGGGDWTVGAKVILDEYGRWTIADIVRGQWSSAQKQNVIRQTAASDGRYVPIRMEQEPGSSGVDVIDMYRRQVLVGYDFDGVRSTGSKTDRAAPMSAAAEAGNVKLVAGPWNSKFLDEAVQFPFGNNDDQIDAVSGGMNHLAFGRRARLLA